jgi:hypothetical protein
LEQVVPKLADAIMAQGESPRTVLRSKYLELNKHWGGLLKAAQTAGIAKQYKRGLASDMTEMGATPSQEDPAVD